jgi:hypothetical protein
MLGLYTNFPQNVHKIAVFSTSISSKRLQQILTEIFQKLNNVTLNLEEITTPSLPLCTVVFEFGVAEDNDFNYLNNQEEDRLLKAINKKPFQVMDFLCLIRYYKTQREKKAPLRFDYYMLRFTFDKNSTAMQVFHERGPMHMSPEDLAQFVVNNVNATFSKKVLKSLEIP